jgi:methylenetetrahydrofolate dehydrogenase (NADP+)/methenyltetrahydrofolate cyclohydrolase
MTKLLYGAPAADGVRGEAAGLAASLGFAPALAIVRTGSEPDDLAYEKSIRAACAKCGVEVFTAELPGYTPQDVLVSSVRRVAGDRAVHGVIVMCPRQYDLGLLGAAIGPDKDVDGMGYMEGRGAFAPCTAESVLSVLDFYGIECAGRRVTVVGRGALAGAAAAMLLEDRGAVVSVCHRGTENPEELCRSAEILVCAAGKAGLIGRSRLSPGQTVVDVGINVLPGGGVCGDVDMDAARDLVAAVTPVPGGVGAVTPYILALHTALAAQRLQNI